MRVKIDIVIRDPFEQGERAKLNLGHTFGHALERLSRFQMRHGDAVAIGLVCASRLSAPLEECTTELLTRVEGVLRHLGLPTRIPSDFSAESIVEAMQTDKKRIGKHLRFVLPRAPGDVVIRDQVDQQEVLAVLQQTISA
jgi:3-dehydroquinate synthetase